MKWKDTGKMIDKEAKPRTEYFDEEQYTPWVERNDLKKSFRSVKTPFLVIILAATLAALIVALFLLLSKDGDANAAQSLSALEERVQRLEERLDKYAGIDEKVTRIWEQAKAFEKFADRFDRSEASTSLRMDHLTMSLEALQKQLNVARQAAAASPTPAAAAQTPSTAQAEDKTIRHKVVGGETLYQLSKKYNVSVEKLRKLNNLSSNSISTGQTLIIREKE